MIVATNCLRDDELLPLAEGLGAEKSIEEHLQQCSSCQQRLGRLRNEVAQVRSLLKNVDPAELAGEIAAAPDRPAKIGRYIIVGELGRGGQAAVYRAAHPTLQKDLIIKWSLSPALASEADQHLLVEEGRLLAQFDHPHIARVYDLDVHEGRPFLAMEYIRGVNLEDYRKEHHPSTRQVAAILATVARAAGAAHRAGVVHRDIKPRNIMVDEHGQAYLIDFGMARFRSAMVDRPGDASEGGGTISFMAPEQARGENEQVGPHSDIFALGATLYAMLVGKSPFNGADVLQVLDRAQRCDFDREALARAGAPAGLARICLRAMAPRPQDRYPTADALADALQRWLRRPARWKKTLVAAAAVLALAAGGMLGYHYWPDSVMQQDDAGLPAQQDILRVIRGGQPLDLKAALPLENGEAVEIALEVPTGWNYAIIAVDTRGRLHQLTPAVLPGRSGTVRLKYPGEAAVPLDDAAGTELILAFAAPATLDLDRIRRIFAEGQPLPTCAARVQVRLGRDGVMSSTSGPITGELGTQLIKNDLSSLEALLERVRSELLAQKAQVISGVAFSHGTRTAL